MINKSVRRVPLDFDWPIGHLWEGFVNPHNKHFVVCEHCGGLAVSKEARTLEHIWYGRRPPVHDRKAGIMDFGTIECEFGFVFHFTRRVHDKDGLFYLTMQQRSYNALRSAMKLPSGHHDSKPINWETFRKSASQDLALFSKIHSGWMYLLDQDDVDALHAGGALRRLTHDWYKGEWIEKEPKVIPTVEQVNLYMHDEACDDVFTVWMAIEAFCRRHHLAFTCPHCQGRGGSFPDEATRVAAKSWKSYAPPAGPGYQFWDPSEEGAPLSPVFETPQELISWMVKQGIRLNRNVDVKKTLKWIQSNGTKGLSSTEFIWLCRDYQIHRVQTFHPTLLPDLAYQAVVVTQ
jgi:hypothetical protein